MTRTAVALIAMIALAGCATGAGDPSDADPSRPQQSPNVEPVPSSSEAPITGEVPADLLDRILADAADHSSVAADAIEVIRAEAVEWSDGSLGCPEPGMLYTQAIEPGYQVILDADGAELDYRATASGTFRLCESGGAPLGG